MIVSGLHRCSIYCGTGNFTFGRTKSRQDEEMVPDLSVSVLCSGWICPKPQYTRVFEAPQQSFTRGVQSQRMLFICETIFQLFCFLNRQKLHFTLQLPHTNLITCVSYIALLFRWKKGRKHPQALRWQFSELKPIVDINYYRLKEELCRYVWKSQQSLNFVGNITMICSYWAFYFPIISPWTE